MHYSPQLSKACLVVSGRETLFLLLLVMGQILLSTQVQGACLDVLCKAQEVPVVLLHENRNVVAAQCRRLLYI